MSVTPSSTITASRVPVAVYTAWRGYDWSGIPDGLTREQMDALRAKAVARRPAFADADTVTTGIVSHGVWAAVFAIRVVPAWDAVGRAADYAAFAFLPVTVLPELNVRMILAHPFFTTPTHEPPTFLQFSSEVGL